MTPSTRGEKAISGKTTASADILPLLVILLLAYALRIYHLDYQSLWVDEGISLVRSSLSLSTMMQSLPREHVPGYWLALGAWLSAAGTTDFALRYLSLIPSVLTIAIAYRLAADLGLRRAGLVAALLLATSEFQVWYAQEARMYSWLVAAGIGSTWLLWRLLNASKPALPLVGYVLLVSIALNLHFYGFLIPIAHTVFAVFWLWNTHRVRAFLYWIGAGILVLVSYLPWWPRLLSASEFRGCCPALDPALLPWRFFVAYTVGDAMPPVLRDALPWVYLGLVLLGIWSWFRRNLLGCLLLSSAVLVPLAVEFAIAATTRGFYHERYTIFLSVPLAMLVAGGFAILDQTGWPSGGRDHSLRPRFAPGVLVAALALAILAGGNCVALWRLYTYSAIQKPDFRAIVRRIEASESPGDLVLVHGLNPREIFLHYYRGGLPVQEVNTLLDLSSGEIDAGLSRLTDGEKRVWMLHYYPPTTEIEYWLASNGWLANRTKYGNTNLTLSVYGLPGLPQRELPQAIAFGPQLRLDRAVVAGGGGEGLAFRAGDLVGVSTEWDVLEPPPSLTFSLRLVDADGRTWLSSDSVPLEGSAPTQTWPSGKRIENHNGLLLPPDLPPGTYRLFLMLYDPATGIPVRAGNEDGVSLASIEVSSAAAAPDPFTLPIPERVSRRIGDGLELLGFAVTPQPLRPAQGATLTLWWRAIDPPEQPYQIRVEATDRDLEPAFVGTYPLSETALAWKAGQVVQERYDLELDPAAATGAYRLVVAVETPDGRPIGLPLDLGFVAVSARSRLYRLPRIDHTLEMMLGDSVLLRGYDLALPEASEGVVDLTLYWQSKQRVPGSYKVFVHLVDDSGRIVAQADSFPAAGLAPSESWKPGEIVVDSHVLAAPGPGRYHLHVGLYDPVSGERLSVREEGGSLLPDSAAPLGDVEIAPAR